MSRYLLLTEFFPPTRGGIQRSLATILAVLKPNVTVVSPQSPDTLDLPVIQRSLFSGAMRPRWWWLIGFLHQQQRQGITLAIFGHYSQGVLAGWISRRLFGLPYVVLVHGQDILFERRRGVGRIFLSAALRGADWVGVNSTYTAGLVQSAGVPEVQIIRTHPAVSADYFTLRHSSAHTIRFVTVSRLVKRKNIATVLRALAGLHTIDWVYHVIGTGSELPALQVLAKDLGVDQRVFWHGALAEVAKMNILSESDIAIMIPTVEEQGSDVEGLGLFYLESAAAGLPIIASPTGGVTDAVNDGQNGFLIDPNNIPAITAAMRRLASHPDERVAMGAAGRKIMTAEFTDIVRNARVSVLLGHGPTEPLVSIVIPAFQTASSIGRAIASVEKQTWRAWEIIVVNDGSMDDLDRVMAHTTAPHQYITQSNQGAGVARNRGAQAARGEYLLFLDADAVLVPEAVQKMLAALQTHPEASYAYPAHIFGPKTFRSFAWSAERLRQMNYIHTTALIRREHFPGFDPLITRFQDWDMWLTMLQAGRRGIHIPEILFRVAGGGTMSQWVPRFMYRLPLIGRGRGNKNIRSYRAAEAVIRKKHRL